MLCLELAFRFIANNYGNSLVNQNPEDKLGRLIFTLNIN